MYLIVNHASGYIEEKNRNKYLIFDDSVNENEGLLKKYADVSDGIRNEIKATNGDEKNNYGKDYTKIKFNSNDDLPLNKPLKFHVMTITSVFRRHFVWIIKMLKYEKIDVSERIDTNKTIASKECELCHYWYFKDVRFKFESHVSNKCHALITAYELKNIAILNVKGIDFRCISWGISRDEAVNRLNDSVLEDKGVL